MTSKNATFHKIENNEDEAVNIQIYRTYNLFISTPYFFKKVKTKYVHLRM